MFRFPSGAIYHVGIRVVLRILRFYFLVCVKYPNTWTRHDALSYSFKIFACLRSGGGKGTFVRRTPLIAAWGRMGLLELYVKSVNWYFGFRVVGTHVYFEEAEWGKNMTIRAFPHRRTALPQSPNYSSLGKIKTVHSFGSYSIVKNASGLFNFMDSEGRLISNRWFKDVKPFHKCEMGNIAFVNYGGNCYALRFEDGALFNMNKTWKECFVESRFIRHMLEEQLLNKRKSIYISESELRNIIADSIKRALYN